MDPSTSTNLKRKCSSPIQDQSTKASKQRTDTSIDILDLSDCILLEILKYLDATSLYHLGETCNRFGYLVQDQSLWMHIEGRSEPNTLDKIDFCWKNIGPKSRSLKLSGHRRSQVLLSSKILDSNKLSSLTILALEHQCIKYCRLNEFPKSLEEISFRHSYIPKHSIFFRFSEKQMSNLRVLILDHCKWFDANSFTSLSKYQKLEVLSLYMCKKLTEDEIANVTIAGRVGFKALKVADLRFTGLGEVFIRTFYSNPSIQIIYFQCYGTTYATERYKRKLDIINGSKTNDYSYLSDDDDNNTDLDWVRKCFNAKKTQRYETQTIKDYTMIIYKRVQKVKVESTRPTTVLYKYPYDSCACGFYSKPTPQISFAQHSKVLWDADVIRNKLENEISRQRKNRADVKGGEIYFIMPNTSKVCDKIAFDSCMMPDWCHIDASPTAPIHKWLYTRTPRNDFEISMLEHVDKHYLTQLNRQCNLVKSCMCLQSPLRGNAIVMKPPELEGQWPCFGERHFILDSDVVNDQYENFPLISHISNHVTDIKNSKDSLEVHNIGYRIVKLILDSECLGNYDVLEDKDFMGEICQLIHSFAVSIKFDVFHVIAHHSCCFDDLCRHIRSHCDVRECLKFFFANLLKSVQGDFLEKVCESGLSELQLTREEQEENDITNTSDSLGNTVNLESFVHGQRSEMRRIFVNPCRSISNTLRLENINVISHVDVPKECTTVLKELSLRGYTHVTDLTLMVLKDLDLELLDVTGTNITTEGAQQFMTYNPQCWLIHESACICRPSLHF
ncbi:hypothetical protein RN001_010459 [Aquatica leii]|uniref:F-box domain-containing protein n=1 Tax=Aquatica leii TaxID=1421715 RepID=A0AAN7QHG7_9COLE|nr:hypothetical protein RN001_010459 [Aquatica leii]